MKVLLFTFFLLASVTAFPPANLETALTNVKKLQETHPELEEITANKIDLEGYKIIIKLTKSMFSCQPAITAVTELIHKEFEVIGLAGKDAENEHRKNTLMFSGQATDFGYSNLKTIHFIMYYPTFTSIFHQVDTAGKEICGGYAYGWIKESIKTGSPADINFLKDNTEALTKEQDVYEEKAGDYQGFLKMGYWIERAKSDKLTIKEENVDDLGDLGDGAYWLNFGAAGGHFTAIFIKDGTATWFDPDYGIVSKNKADIMEIVQLHWNRIGNVQTVEVYSEKKELEFFMFRSSRGLRKIRQKHTPYHA